MSYIPKDAKWYLAEIVQEITISGDSGNIVHTNLILVRADSPEEAFENANGLGRQGNVTYTNPEGKAVVVNYRGLRDLNVIHGDLEHGTELIYDERTDMDNSELDAWITPKDELGVFRKIPGTDRT